MQRFSQSAIADRYLYYIAHYTHTDVALSLRPLAYNHYVWLTGLSRDLGLLMADDG